jgi:hypothetical protein
MLKEIRGVDTNPKGRPTRQLGRMQGPGQAAPETVQESKYPCGLPRHGTDLAKVSGPDKSEYRDGEKHRAALRDTRNDK